MTNTQTKLVDIAQVLSAAFRSQDPLEAAALFDQMAVIETGAEDQSEIRGSAKIIAFFTKLMHRHTNFEIRAPFAVCEEKAAWPFRLINSSAYDRPGDWRGIASIELNADSKIKSLIFYFET